MNWYRRALRIAAIGAVAGATLFFAGCEQILNEVLGIDAPTNLEASDGEYTASVALSWTGVAEEDADGTARTIAQYEVERSPSWSGPTSIKATGSTTTSYTDSDVVVGEEYTYRVRAVFGDGSRSDWSASDTGYAMNAAALLVTADGSETRSYSAGSTPVWHTFPVQEGWSYTVSWTGSTTGTVYREGTLTQLATNAGSSVSFTALRSEFVYVKLDGGSGTVSARHE